MSPPKFCCYKQGCTTFLYLHLCVFIGFCRIAQALCDLPPLTLPYRSPPSSFHSYQIGTLPPLHCLSPLPRTLFPQVLPWHTPTPPSSLCSKASKLGTFQSLYVKLQFYTLPLPHHSFLKSCSNFLYSTYHQHTLEQCCLTVLPVMMEMFSIWALSYT